MCVNRKLTTQANFDVNYSALNGRLQLSMLVFPKLPQVWSRDDGCYTEEVVISICVMFGEDCIAISLIIGYWNQVSLGVLKTINGL